MSTEYVEGIDLFSGPGGWDVAATLLGWHVLGVEIDDAAVATRLAAGLPTLQGDVAALDPRGVLAGFTAAPCGVLIASPPCTTFSMAGKGIGRKILPELAAALHEVARAPRHSSIEPIRERLIAKLANYGTSLERDATPEEVDDGCELGVAYEDEGPEGGKDAFVTTLVLEPMRWLRDLGPEMLAMEQVPPVLPLWEVYCRILRDDLGWRSAWCGVLNAADFGVPQTRQRAVVIAHRTEVIQPPEPTHCKGGSEPSLFGPGLAPWVSMAQALGWGMTAKPSAVGFPRRADGGAATEDGYRERDLRSIDEPAQAVTEKARSWEVHTKRDQRPDGTQQVVGDDRPAPTVTPDIGGQWEIHPEGAQRVRDAAAGRWQVEIRRGGDRIEEGFDPEAEPAQTVTTRVNRWQLRNGNQDNAAVRDLDEPASTIAFGHNASGVLWEPAPMDGGEQPPLPDELLPRGLASSNRPGDARRAGENRRSEAGIDEPALTIDTTGSQKWTLRTGHNSMKHSRDPQDMVPFERDVDEPAPTLDAKVGSAWKVAPEGEHVDPPMRWKNDPSREWTEDRPATTIAGDSRVHPPGHKLNADDERRLGADEAAERYNDRKGSEAIRISVDEAAVLQSFPRDYPWQGSRTKQFQQVGNAVPPLLAWHVLRAVARLR